MSSDTYKIELIGSDSLPVMTEPVSSECIEDKHSGIANWEINRIVSFLENQMAWTCVTSFI